MRVSFQTASAFSIINIVIKYVKVASRLQVLLAIAPSRGRASCRLSGGLDFLTKKGRRRHEGKTIFLVQYSLSRRVLPLSPNAVPAARRRELAAFFF